MNTRRVRTSAWKRRSTGGSFGSLKLPKGLAKNLLLALGVLCAFGSLVVFGMFAYVSRDLPDPNALTDRTISQTTKIYDRTGEHLLYEIYGKENRTLMKIQQGFCDPETDMETDPNGIPLLVLKAAVAVEDPAFCSHNGIRIKSILRAVVFAGNRGGGSTLTQQLVKNAILSNERTITRKVKEVILSLALERRYSKDEILQIYFNEIPYGSTYYGIEAASQNYYGKQAKDLTLAEAATLAGLPQLPSYYLNHPDSLKARRDFVLDQMVENDFITQEDAEVAKATETPIKTKVSNIQAPHFVFYVKEQLDELYGTRQVAEGGLKVITSLDYDVQKIAEEEITNGVEARGERYQFGNASLVAVDPKTGQVLAMVGSADYFNDDIDGQVNVAVSPRQPGSSFKPIVYAKAFEEGYTPNTVLWDVDTDFPSTTGVYHPRNYDLGERGPIRAREALQGSLNIPAVKMLYMAGVNNTLDFADKLGYTTLSDRDRFGLSVVLGGGEVKLLEHTAAYATFANEGVHHNPVSILKIEDASGSVLQEWNADEGERVTDQNTARTITDVLADNGARAYVFGPNSSLQLGDRPVAAKTGTTNDYHDAWTMGYTPSLAVGVWVGNADNAEMKRGADGSVIAAPIWNAVMKRALQGKPIETFTKPEIKLTGKAVLDGQITATTVEIDTASGKLATEFTPPSKREQRMYAQYHSILQYVSRADPLGPAPSDPSRDPQYVAWEAGVAGWISRKEAETGVTVSNGAAPTEYDDVHIPANIPSVEIVSPFENESFENRVVQVAVNASAPRGVSRVELYLDGFYLGTDTSSPFELSVRIPNTVSRGYHTLKAIAYDDVDNAGSDTVGIRLASDATNASFSVVDPKNNQTIDRSKPTFNVAVELQNPSSIRRVITYAKPVGSGERQVVGIRVNPDSPFLTFEWALPEASGEWVLSAVAEPIDGSPALETAGVMVRVNASATPTPTESTTDPEDSATPPSILNPFAHILP